MAAQAQEPEDFNGLVKDILGALHAPAGSGELNDSQYQEAGDHLSSSIQQKPDIHSSTTTTDPKFASVGSKTYGTTTLSDKAKAILGDVTYQAHHHHYPAPLALPQVDTKPDEAQAFISAIVQAAAQYNIPLPKAPTQKEPATIAQWVQGVIEAHMTATSIADEQTAIIEGSQATSGLAYAGSNDSSYSGSENAEAEDAVPLNAFDTEKATPELVRKPSVHESISHATQNISSSPPAVKTMRKAPLLKERLAELNDSGASLRSRLSSLFPRRKLKPPQPGIASEDVKAVEAPVDKTILTSASVAMGSKIEAQSILYVPGPPLSDELGIKTSSRPAENATSKKETLQPGDVLICVHYFDARSPDELTIRKADRIELIELDDDFGDGWYLGRHLVNGQTGLFPGAPSQKASPPQARAQSSTPLAKSAEIAIAKLPIKKVIRATKDCLQPLIQAHLLFYSGDYLHVVGRDSDSSWYEARNPLAPHTKGFVPVAYFEVIEDLRSSTRKTAAGSTTKE